MPAKQSESDFCKQVIQLARLYGWKVAHFRPAMTKHGWRTPVQGDGKGFPDCILVRNKVIVAELKSEKGKPSAEQVEWLDRFRAAGCEAYLWKPEDWDDLVAILTAEPPPLSTKSG